jgi:hypothetical protein
MNSTVQALFAQRANNPTHGQIPRFTISRDLTEMSRVQSVAEAVTDYAEPILRIEKVASGIGIDSGTELRLLRVLRSLLDASNVLELKQRLWSILHYDFVLDSTQRKAIIQRMTSLWGNMKNLNKSVNPYATKTKTPKGGNYYRRVTDSNGKHKYFKTQEEYLQAVGDDTHISGADAKKETLKRAVMKHIGEMGAPIDSLHALTNRHDAKDIADIVREGIKNKEIEHRKGRLRKCKTEEISKSFGLDSWLAQNT